MSGALSTTDVLCGGVPSTPVKGYITPYIAQAYALALFKADFEVRYPAGEVLSELEVFKQRTGKGLIDMVLGVLSSDFRNYYAQTQKNRNLIAAGKNALQLKEGRARKADGLGIAVDPLRRAIVCELMEVTTADQAESTIIGDLAPKLALLRGPIKTFVDDKLASLSGSMSLMPQKFIASGTPWIIPPELCIVPIFPEGGMATEPSIYRWICFAPTYKYRPMGIASPFVTTVESDTSPAKGLILYSMHETGNPNLAPSEVFKKVREWAAQQLRQQSLGPQLLPIPQAMRYWQDNRSDLKQFLGWVALGTAAIAIVVLAIYLAPVVIAAGAPLFFQLITATEGAALLAPAVIAALARYLPLLLQAARTMLNSAINVGGIPSSGF